MVIRNIRQSKYSKYFKPNATVYNAVDNSVVPATNALTGTRASYSELKFTPNTFNQAHFTCILEYQAKLPQIPQKEGFNSSDVILQGRLYEVFPGNDIPDYPDYFSHASWYRVGGRYLLDSEYLGKGIVYALPQIASMYDAEKYFGYPLMMRFSAINNTNFS